MPPPEDSPLSLNILRILEAAGFRDGSARRTGTDRMGFLVIPTNSGVQVSVGSTSEELWDSAWGVPGKMSEEQENLRTFRRQVEAVLTGAYVAVLQAAGFTMTVRPDRYEDGAYIMVTDGPTDGIAFIPEGSA